MGQLPWEAHKKPQSNCPTGGRSLIKSMGLLVLYFEKTLGVTSILAWKKLCFSSLKATNSKTKNYPVSYIIQLNTLKGTSKLPLWTLRRNRNIKHVKVHWVPHPFYMRVPPTRCPRPPQVHPGNITAQNFFKMKRWYSSTFFVRHFIYSTSVFILVLFTALSV